LHDKEKNACGECTIKVTNRGKKIKKAKIFTSEKVANKKIGEKPRRPRLSNREGQESNGSRLYFTAKTDSIEKKKKFATALVKLREK